MSHQAKKWWRPELGPSRGLQETCRGQAPRQEAQGGLTCGHHVRAGRWDHTAAVADGVMSRQKSLEVQIAARQIKQAP
eukprot:1161733-Pelagomonas_calceolata.AAC.3